MNRWAKVKVLPFFYRRNFKSSRKAGYLSVNDRYMKVYEAKLWESFPTLPGHDFPLITIAVLKPGY